MFYFAEGWKSVWNLIDKESTVYLNNTSSKKLLGVIGAGNVGTHNSFTHLANNFWNKGEVDSRGFFTLTSLTAKKNLRATSKTDLDLVEKGVLFVMSYKLSL